MNTCPPDKSKIARELIDQLLGLSEPEDTLDGIIRRYLPGTPTESERTLVKEVVGDLVTQGVFEKVQKEGRTVYRARPKR